MLQSSPSSQHFAPSACGATSSFDGIFTSEKALLVPKTKVGGGFPLYKVFFSHFIMGFKIKQYHFIEYMAFAPQKKVSYQIKPIIRLGGVGILTLWCLDCDRDIFSD